MDFRLPCWVMKWVGPIIILGLGIVVIVGSPIGQISFCGKTDNCIVAWVGALSGWAAVGAAVVTVIFLRRQISDTEKHHREAIALEKRHLISVAKRVVAMTEAAVAQTGAYNELAAQHSPRSMREKLASTFHLSCVTWLATYNNSVFDEFENDIGTDNPLMLDNIRVHLTGVVDVFSPSNLPTLSDEDMIVFIDQVAANAELYAEFVKKAADQFSSTYRAATQS